ncbi:MAG: LytTR family DNA-binding domain-containing protein [Gemmatimonadales bacterium]
MSEPVAGVSRVTAFVADDEPVARGGLRDMLEEISWVKWIGEAASGTAAVEAINRLRPDLVFLDVQMPGLLGTDVLRHITHQPYVVFTTAYAQHAVTGFELGALDYLLKPFGAERLASAMDRVRAAIGEPSARPTVDRLREALSKRPMTRLFVRSGNSIVPIAVETVSSFEAWGDYVTAHAAGGRHMMHLSLNHLESRLDPAKFVRIHRAHIVNLDHVKAFKSHGRGRVTAQLIDGAELPVSRGRAAGLRGLGT